MHTGEPIDPLMEGIFDNYAVKRQIINSGYGEKAITLNVISCYWPEKLLFIYFLPVSCATGLNWNDDLFI